MMKMLRASYEHKQEKLKNETKGRLAKHRQEIAGIEAKKARKLQQVKKDVFRKRSKGLSRQHTEKEEDD